MMRCERCGSCSSEQEARRVGLSDKSSYPKCPVCGSAQLQNHDWLTPALCGEHVPIICKSCQSKLDGSCEYVGSPIRTFGSPKNYCVTYKFPKTDPKDNCAIADSGNRREFDTGAVRDMQEGKVEKINSISFAISKPGYYCIQIKENEGWALLKKV